MLVAALAYQAAATMAAEPLAAAALATTAVVAAVSVATSGLDGPEMVTGPIGQQTRL